MTNLLSMRDLDARGLREILAFAARLKERRTAGVDADLLRGRSLAMIFEKASTRTRISFEIGMYELGGYPLFLNPKDMQLGRGEEIRDTARVLSRYVSAVMIRAYRHSMIEEFARWAEVPVINGLSDREHPCQLLADLQTIREHFGSTRGLKVAWVGDGNNVANSLILASPLAGIEVAVASPSGYQPSPDLVQEANAAGGKVWVTEDPKAAADGADALYTDVWVSMGDEAERAVRLRAFQGYTIDDALVARANERAIVLHCLPAHRGEEITESVIEGPRSVVWQQAENRLHAEKALLVKLLGALPKD